MIVLSVSASPAEAEYLGSMSLLNPPSLQSAWALLYTGNGNVGVEMSYCPQCLTEYADTATECIDCCVPLQKGARPASPADDEGPEPEPQLVRLRTFSGPTAVMEADLAKNLLQEQGIISFVPGETSAEILPGIDVVQIWVREEDADRASDVLKSYLDLVEEPDIEDDEDEADDDSLKN
jgi:putative signal transducing protein